MAKRVLTVAAKVALTVLALPFVVALSPFGVPGGLGGKLLEAIWGVDQ